jgi:hypothetical protein
MGIMTDISEDKQGSDLLKMALDHVARWNEFHVTSGLQVINFFLVSAAVLGAAYVSALNGHLHLIAGVIALVGAGASGAAYLIARRQGSIARLAWEPLKEIQHRIAGSLNIDSLRMAERADASTSGRVFWRRSNFTITAIFSIDVALGVAAAIYAWLSG